ncbi:MAG: LCP family protein [Clostridia bacterium]|nr:LCP family protein [Clostridia bacterium]
MSDENKEMYSESQQRIKAATEAIRAKKLQALQNSASSIDLDKPIPPPSQAVRPSAPPVKAEKTQQNNAADEVVFYDNKIDYGAPIPSRDRSAEKSAVEPIRTTSQNAVIPKPITPKPIEPKPIVPKPIEVKNTVEAKNEPDSAKNNKTVSDSANEKNALRDDSSKLPKNNEQDKKEVTFIAPKKKAKKVSKKRIILSVCASLLALIMFVSGTGCIVMYSYFNRVNYQAIDTENSVVKENDTSSILPEISTTQNTDTYEGKLLNDKQILNILLIGADTRANQDTGNSDTMILMSIDTKSQKLKLLSFMRDTYVAIPGYGENKLNASFTYGGAELTVKTIQANYGIQIDRYAIVDFKSFKNIIDAIGGIDIELTQEEVDYIDWQCWKNNQVETRNELNAYSYTYKPNKNGDEVAKIHLNGRQALWHARNRGEDGICSGDDYVRTQRQRNVISIMINKLKKSDATTVMNIIYEIGPMVTTNLKTSEITGLASNITKYLKYDIMSQSAPDYSNIEVDFYYSDPYERPVYIYGEYTDCILIIDWENFRNKVADFVFYSHNSLKKSEDEDTE